MTLFERVTQWMDVQARKHELGPNYVEDTVNAMSNYELLQAISNALSERQDEQRGDDIPYDCPEITDNPNL